MNCQKKYSQALADRTKIFIRIRLLFGYLFLLLFAILFVLIPIKVKADGRPFDEKSSPVITFDELPMDVYIGADLSFNINTIISNTDSLYIDIEELFKKLAIPCVISNSGNSLGGFIGNESNTYIIDFNTNQIDVGDKTYNAHERIINEKGTMYIESNLLAEAFGISLAFNPRSLYLDLKTNIELPIFKQRKLEEARQNISFLQDNQIAADTFVNRDYHLFKFGMFDWALSSTQTVNGPANNFFAIGLGAELLYGEANFSYYYNNQYKFDRTQIDYLWRYVNNDNLVVKQAMVGKVPHLTIAYLKSPLVGASVTNASTTIRKASGYYTINDYTQPNWTVELYINSQLVAFTTADASGLYLFQVPIVYGYTTLTLKFYGPGGEVRIEERTINVPYTILPAKEIEYIVSGGVLEDSASSLFSKAELAYGVSRIFTVAGGMEYLSSIATGAYIPYAKATLQPFSKMTINAEYAYGVRIKSRLSYYFWKNALLEFNFVRNKEGQQATIFNANEERMASLYVPFGLKKFSGYLKADYTQYVYSELNYNQGNLMLSVHYRQFSANNSTHVNWNSYGNAYVTDDLALSVSFRKGYIIRTLAQHNVSDNKLLTLKAEIEKRVSKAYISASYQRNMQFDNNTFNLNFKYYFSFARTAVSVFSSNNKVSIAEGAQGSLAFGGDDYVQAGNNTSVGKGGILLYPFLDLNQNGIFDKGEHLVLLNSVRISGGMPIISEKDSLVRISGLNAFSSYIVEFTDNGLENIAWQFTYKTYQILVDPNQFKRVDIPIISMGEVNGMVYLKEGDNLNGIGRITFQIYDKEGNKVTEILSEYDGYLNYLGLKPGVYKACLDPDQLQNLNLTVSPLCHEFTIQTTEDGDIVNGLDFTLTKTNIEDTLPHPSE